MQNTIREVIESRTSVGKYQADYQLEAGCIEELVRLANLSPSAYNLQNWRFIAVQSNDGKQALQQAAYGQPQIMQASVTFIVCGLTQGQTFIKETLALSVEKNVMPAEVATAWEDAVEQSHASNEELQRDEAIRSASLAAMTMMLAAKGMGLDSGAMGGFDAQQVSQAFQLADNEIPVMLITIGRAQKDNWSQKIRKPIAEVLSFA